MEKWMGYLDLRNESAEYITDDRSEQGQNDDDNESDKNHDKRIFKQALAPFCWGTQHSSSPPFGKF